MSAAAGGSGISVRPHRPCGHPPHSRPSNLGRERPARNTGTCRYVGSRPAGTKAGVICRSAAHAPVAVTVTPEDTGDSSRDGRTARHRCTAGISRPGWQAMVIMCAETLAARLADRKRLQGRQHGPRLAKPARPDIGQAADVWRAGAAAFSERCGQVGRLLRHDDRRSPPRHPGPLIHGRNHDGSTGTSIEISSPA